MLKSLLHAFFATEGLQAVSSDLQRRFEKFPEGSVYWKVRYYWGNPQYRTLLLYRLFRASKGRFTARMFGFLYRRASHRSGLEINTQYLGGGVILPHFGRIIINAAAVGKDLYALHNVTIGHDYRTGRPTIGDNVFIGVGSTVLGDIHVGDNAVIGAGSVVLQDVPANAVIAGNPAKVVRIADPAAASKDVEAALARAPKPMP